MSGLRRVFGDLAAVDGLDLDLATGECVVLIGHNGSKKTTAMRVIAGRLEPTSGSVTVAGVSVCTTDAAGTLLEPVRWVPFRGGPP